MRPDPAGPVLHRVQVVLAGDIRVRGKPPLGVKVCDVCPDVLGRHQPGPHVPACPTRLPVLYRPKLHLHIWSQTYSMLTTNVHFTIIIILKRAYLRTSPTRGYSVLVRSSKQSSSLHFPFSASFSLLEGPTFTFQQSGGTFSPRRFQQSRSFSRRSFLW